MAIAASTSLPSVLLIAAFLRRAHAQSARRAGYRPLVVDCFGDLDAREAAHDLICLPARVQIGFIKRPLITAQEELAAKAPSPPIGLILARLRMQIQSSLQPWPNAPLIGNSAETIRRVKESIRVFGTLARLAFATLKRA